MNRFYEYLIPPIDKIKIAAISTRDFVKGTYESLATSTNNALRSIENTTSAVRSLYNETEDIKELKKQLKIQIQKTNKLKNKLHKLRNRPVIPIVHPETRRITIRPKPLPVPGRITRYNTKGILKRAYRDRDLGPLELDIPSPLALFERTDRIIRLSKIILSQPSTDNYNIGNMIQNIYKSVRRRKLEFNRLLDGYVKSEFKRVIKELYPLILERSNETPDVAYRNIVYMLNHELEPITRTFIVHTGLVANKQLGGWLGVLKFALNKVYLKDDTEKYVEEFNNQTGPFYNFYFDTTIDNLPEDIVSTSNGLGGWFRWVNNSGVDLSRYGIYSENQFYNEPEPCIIRALIESGKISHEVLEDIISSEYVSDFTKKRDLDKIANKAGVKIVVSQYDKGKPIIGKRLGTLVENNKLNKCSRTYGNPDSPTVSVGLYDNHYFINDVWDENTGTLIFNTKYPPPLPEWIVNGPDGPVRQRRNDGRDFTSPISLIHHMMIHGPNGKPRFPGDLDPPKDIFTPLPYEYIQSSPYFWKDTHKKLVSQSDYMNYMSTCEFKEVPIPKVISSCKRLIFYCDCECSTKNIYNKHVPISIACSHKDLRWCETGPDCITKMLSRIDRICIYESDRAAREENREELQRLWRDKKKRKWVELRRMYRDPIIYFHNIKYDISFVIDNIRAVDNVINDGKIYSIKAELIEGGGKYPTVFEFRDSYKILPMPLAEIAKSFGLRPKGGGPEMYELMNNYVDKVMDPTSDPIAADIIKYNIDDTEIQQGGMEKFNVSMKELTGMSIHDKLTISSLSHQHMMNSGCYEEVIKCEGLYGKFIQESVIGGATCIAYDKPFMTTDPIICMDVNSLYPTAMYYFEGIPIGKPKPFIGPEIPPCDFYFVRIRVLECHRNGYPIPICSYINSKDERVYEEIPVGYEMTVNKIQLEDLIEHHDLKYEVLFGHTYNNGYNRKCQNIMYRNHVMKQKFKNEGNPAAQECVKRLTNSAWGKSGMKASKYEVKIVDKENLNNVVRREYMRIKDIEGSLKNGYVVKMFKRFNEHHNQNILASIVLAYSKRLMNRLHKLCKKYGIFNIYKDTDSLFIYAKDLELLKEKYKDEIGEDLIGEELGQMKIEYGGKKTVLSVFLGRKSYYMEFENGEYIFKQKGIPKNVVEDKAKKEERRVGDIYLDAYNGMDIDYSYIDNFHHIGFNHVEVRNRNIVVKG